MAVDRDIASWIRRQLDRQEWSAADLARHSGIPPSRISEWLSGKRTPSSASCLKLADAFNADPDYVLALAGHRPPTPPLQPQDPRTELIALLKRVRLTPDRVAGLEATLRAWLEFDRSTPTDSAPTGR
jgi:transcriptional regulator with XRE-family HTH domain